MKCTLLQEHVCCMLLEQYAFQIWSWSIFDLQYSSRLLMVHLDHMSSQNLKKKGHLPAYSVVYSDFNVYFTVTGCIKVYLEMVLQYIYSCTKCLSDMMMYLLSHPVVVNIRMNEIYNWNFNYYCNL